MVKYSKITLMLFAILLHSSSFSMNQQRKTETLIELEEQNDTIIEIDTDGSSSDSSNDNYVVKDKGKTKETITELEDPDNSESDTYDESRDSCASDIALLGKKRLTKKVTKKLIRTLSNPKNKQGSILQKVMKDLKMKKGAQKYLKRYLNSDEKLFDSVLNLCIVKEYITAEDLQNHNLIDSVDEEKDENCIIRKSIKYFKQNLDQEIKQKEETLQALENENNYLQDELRKNIKKFSAALVTQIPWIIALIIYFSL